MSESSSEKTRREFLGRAGATAGLAAVAATFASGNVVNADEVGLNAMGPTPDQMQAFMKLPDTPVVMVNLLKYKNGSSGSEEYQEYARKVSKILESIGAEIIFSGTCQTTLIGGASWDAVGLVRYPSKMSLIQMAQSEEYRAIHHHREAGLEGQINLAVFENDEMV